MMNKRPHKYLLLYIYFSQCFLHETMYQYIFMKWFSASRPQLLGISLQIFKNNCYSLSASYTC